jgi:hypothetical protein
LRCALASPDADGVRSRSLEADELRSRRLDDPRSLLPEEARVRPPDEAARVPPPEEAARVPLREEAARVPLPEPERPRLAEPEPEDERLDPEDDERLDPDERPDPEDERPPVDFEDESLLLFADARRVEREPAERPLPDAFDWALGVSELSDDEAPDDLERLEPPRGLVADISTSGVV